MPGMPWRTRHSPRLRRPRRLRILDPALHQVRRDPPGYRAAGRGGDELSGRNRLDSPAHPGRAAHYSAPAPWARGLFRGSSTRAQRERGSLCEQTCRSWTRGDTPLPTRLGLPASCPLPQGARALQFAARLAELRNAGGRLINVASPLAGEGGTAARHGLGGRGVLSASASLAVELAEATPFPTHPCLPTEQPSRKGRGHYN
jgi:hypothetical protein